MVYRVKRFGRSTCIFLVFVRRFYRTGRASYGQIRYDRGFSMTVTSRQVLLCSNFFGLHSLLDQERKALG